MEKLVRALPIAAICTCLLGVVAGAEDRLQPTVSVTAGQFLLHNSHDNIVQTDVILPVFRSEPVTLRYHYREITPFWQENSQAQLLYTRHQFQADIKLTGDIGLIAVGGYRRSAAQDRAGSLGAGTVGLGVGSLPQSTPPTLEWSVVAGSFFCRDDLAANWWFDAHAAWRFHTFAERQSLDIKYRSSLGLLANVEAVNEDASLRGHYQIGPFLDFLTANGNRARIFAGWYFADGNPFYEDRESALLGSIQINSSLDKPALFNARDDRPRGWLPLVWGEYDLGWGGNRTLQRTELDAEIQDMLIAGHRVTGRVWYETRHEYQRGDFDNISYSVSAGVQTEVGLASVLSQGQPLVAGLEYLHRSAHALAADPTRVPPSGFIPRNNINVGPRLRLQTLGWDLPYRDPSIYQGDFRWLHHFDWRLTIGHDFNSSRNRQQPAAQAGLKWDIAAAQGCVAYARAIGSIGNETPDWLFETGIRRQAGKLFFRAERYGLESRLARGNLYAAGIGFYL